MAIDYGISSLDTGASDITYSGDEGPKSPDQQLMASADPMLVEEYKKYVFEMEEQGQTPISFKQFIQQIMSESRMAEGGIARLGYANGQLVQPGLGRPGYGGPQDWGQQERAEKRAAAGTAPGSKGDEGEYHGMSKSNLQQLSASSPSHGGMDTDWSKTTTYKENFNVPGDDDPEVIEEIKKKQIEDTETARLNKYYDTKASKKVKAKIIKLLQTQFPDEEIGDELSWDQILDFRSALDPTGEKWDERYSDFGTAPEAYPGDGPWFGKYMAAPDFTQSEFDLLVNKGMGNVPTKDEGTGKYIKPVYDEETKTYTSGFEKWQPSDPREADWLEEMKFNNPMQYANYMGMDYNLHTGVFTKRREDGYGGVPGATAHGDMRPLWQRLGYGSEQEYINAGGGATAQGGGGGSNIPTESAASPFPYTVDPNTDDLTQGRGGWFYNDGGRAGYAGGGIADLRQGYFLGKIVKKLKRGAKKLTKSKLGRAALMAGLGTWGFKNLGGISGLKELAGGSDWKADLVKGLLMKGGTDDQFSPWKLGIGAAALYPLIMGDDEEDDEGKMYEDWLKEKAKWDARYAAIPTGSLPSPYSRNLMGAADGGRIGYQGGYNVDDDDEEDRVAALRALYGMRRNAQEGGLMDMGGMEKDYRQEGGFVPIGGQERADDVPARLSKNEFVFTADAVRAAGGGDIDAGAEVMENVMENLEQGGEISQQSQGLEGARDMFATAQRLEGVL